MPPSPWEGIEVKVLEAYISKGLRARPYDVEPESTGACCAVGALAHPAGPQEAVYALEHRVGEQLGISMDDLRRFESSFDDALIGRKLFSLHPACQAGMRTGVAVIGAGLVNHSILPPTGEDASE